MNPTPTALFFKVPGHGHVNPSLPLVAELTRRGHRITYFITEAYRAKVEAAGANVQLYSTVPDEVDMGRLTAALIGVVEETVQPEKICVWLIEDAKIQKNPPPNYDKRSLNGKSV